MILTVTLNAALDVTYRVPVLEPHASHRVTAVARRAGGKGINTGRVLAQLGHVTLATGLVGGPTGAAIRDDLDRSGLRHRFADAGGESRTAVAVVDERHGDATVFNEPGPMLTDADWVGFLATYDDLVASASAVVIGGSLPEGLPADACGVLVSRSAVRAYVDTSGPGLLAAARAGAVVLPNAAELAEATGVPDPRRAATELLAAGAEAVVVSLGAAGVLAVTPDRAWCASQPEVLRGNPTGAGDALTAAVLAHRDLPWPQALVEAVAWSAAAVPMPLAGEVDPEVIARLRPLVVVEELED